MSNTGKYKYDPVTGTVVKISNRARVGDIWFKKYQLNAADDMRAGYKSLDDQQKLGQVDDRECWDELRQEHKNENKMEF